MRLVRFIFVIAILAVGGAGPASAMLATVDFDGAFVGMTPSPLDIGQQGTITSDFHIGKVMVQTITGALPANSMIEFSYNFKGTLSPAALLSGIAEYSYTDGGNDYAGWAADIANSGVPFATGTTNGTLSAALAFVSAQITGPNTATVIIKNFSAGVLDFATLFLGAVKGGKDVSISYLVSPVPVPAALPMFGLGVAALAGYRARRNSKERMAETA